MTLDTTRGLRILVAAIALAGCSPIEPSADEPTGEATSALTGENGIWQNGLTTNGIWQNGIWQNGIWQNGIWQNGIWQNGIWQNGIWQNGIWQNGIWQNGIWQNGIWQNGIWQNGIWQNGVWEGNLEAREMLRTNPYAGKLLQYIYSCAMPAGATKTLDPTTLDPEGANVVLTGSIGLAPDWDSDGGECDETCQRWVSACVLARTNAYGVTVDISMRAPETAPDHIKAALAVTDDERAQYPLREGAFYGNLFATTPPPEGTEGPIVNTPSFYACAGPGSNIPDITKRFCSSQGDNGPIQVPGVCEATTLSRGACDMMDADRARGAMQRCYTNTDPAKPRTQYQEVITVYLKDPIEVCGNAVCEATEAGDASCPSDCLPGGWARTYATLFSNYQNNFPPGENERHLSGPEWATTSAVGPDDSVALAGVVRTPVDLGGGMLDMGPDGKQYGVLAKYGPNGQYLWGKRFATDAFGAGGVAVGADGTIAVALEVRTPTLEPGILISKFSPDGELLWSLPSSVYTAFSGNTSLTLDPTGNVIVASDFRFQVAFGALSVTGTAEEHSQIYVLKVSPAGVPLWLISHGPDSDPGSARDSPSTLGTDPDGNVLVGLFSDASPNGLLKLSASSGSLVWAKPGLHWGVTADASGNVYATGMLADPQGSQFDYDLDPGTYDFPIPASAGRGDFFVVKYAGADGTTLAVRTDPPSCRATVPFGPCHGEYVGRAIRVDAEGNLVVGVLGGNGSPMDFGAGAFDSYAFDDVFVSAYTPDFDFLWAKHMPMVLEGALRGLDIDSRGRIVVSGTYAGSMLFDNRLLVNNIPEHRGNGNAFLASFRPPSPADIDPPVMSHVPEDIVLEATSPAGATGWFMPPTAIDDGHAGTNVNCSPPPSSTFPLGKKTTVTCTADDPLGTSSSTTFDIIVRDTIPPMLTGIAPGGVTAQATGPSGAIVPFDTPTALDQVDGDQPVHCSPSSGDLFPFGVTTVSCSASDASGNESTTSFTVSVVDTTPPALPLPGPITANATSASGAVVTYVATAVDTVDGPIVPTCEPPSGSLFAPGTTIVDCEATDSHGNTAIGSFPVQVPFVWSGFQQPIDADGSSIFKLGSTVSVKFQLSGASAGITDAVATLTMAKVSSSVTGSDTEAISNSQATEGNTFRYDATTDQYVFNLSTKGLSVGTWRLTVDLGDGVSRTVLISLKK